jgi:hypothetical protein
MGIYHSDMAMRTLVENHKAMAGPIHSSAIKGNNELKLARMDYCRGIEDQAALNRGIVF